VDVAGPPAQVGRGEVVAADRAGSVLEPLRLLDVAHVAGSYRQPRKPSRGQRWAPERRRAGSRACRSLGPALKSSSGPPRRPSSGPSPSRTSPAGATLAARAMTEEVEVRAVRGPNTFATPDVVPSERHFTVRAPRNTRKRSPGDRTVPPALLSKLKGATTWLVGIFSPRVMRRNVIPRTLYPAAGEAWLRGPKSS
jgi:hypothetical protein